MLRQESKPGKAQLTDGRPMCFIQPGCAYLTCIAVFRRATANKWHDSHMGLTVKLSWWVQSCKSVKDSLRIYMKTKLINIT